MDTEILSHKGVWKNFDPDAEPLEISLINETESGGLIISEYYFTGASFADGKSRVYAVLARPAGGADDKYPAVIMAEDAETGIDLKKLCIAAKDGYAALGVDYAGEWGEDRARFTLYPHSLEYANFKKSGRHLEFCDATPHETCYYQWAVIFRRAVSFLRELPFIDRGGIGIIGVRRGCSFLWQVAATDNRVGAAAMLFNEWETLDKSVKVDEERERWFSGVAPEAYAIFTQTPVLFLSATNDRRCNMDKIHNMAARMPENVETRLILSPRSNNRLLDKQILGLRKWFDFHLKERGGIYGAPKISHIAKNNKLYLNVLADRPDAVRAVHVYYAYDGGVPAARDWILTEPDSGGGEIFSAPAEVLEDNKNIAAFANVLYKNGVLLTSNCINIDCAKEELTPTAFKTRIMYANSEGAGTFFADDNELTFEYEKEEEAKTVAGPFGVKGVTAGSKLAAYKIGSARYIKNTDSFILADVYSGEPQEAYACIVTDISKASEQTYKAPLKLNGGENWQKVKLEPEDFKSNGRGLEDLLNADLLYFETKTPIALNNMLLV